MSDVICTEDYCIFPDAPAIEAVNLGLSYGGKSAFTGLNLKIPHCSVTAIIGPSGCGKSSFLSCINRMTDYYDDCEVTGDLLFNGESVFSQQINLMELRRKVGMIFQKPNPFPVSIYKNLDLPLKYHGHSKAERPEIIESTLKEVGLWDEVKDRFKESALKLSGGQQQRLCIARTIALKPQVILLDEPCSALDPISSGVVEELIFKLKRKFTVVVVTHNIGQAKRLSDQTALFWVQKGQGRLVEFGPTPQFFETPKTSVCMDYISGSIG